MAIGRFRERKILAELIKGKLTLREIAEKNGCSTAPVSRVKALFNRNYCELPTVVELSVKNEPYWQTEKDIEESLFPIYSLTDLNGDEKRISELPMPKEWRLY